PLVSITFDVPQIALASISVDSTITLWSIRDKMPFWSGRVYGEGVPSSIDFLEGGLVVGRNQGNIIQLLPGMSTTVLSTIKFSLGNSSNNGGNASKAAVENPDLMFGHLCYDPASRILWVASSARNSLFAVKIGTDSTPIPSAQPSSNINGPAMSTAKPTTPTIRPTFDQIVEFPCSMPTIKLTLVAAEAADENATWTRDPSLVVSAFCLHASGVAEINITQEAYDIAVAKTAAKAAAKTAVKLTNISSSPLPIGRTNLHAVDQTTSTDSGTSRQDHGGPRTAALELFTNLAVSQNVVGELSESSQNYHAAHFDAEESRFGGDPRSKAKGHGAANVEPDATAMPWIKFDTFSVKQANYYRQRSTTAAAYGGFSDVFQCDARLYDGTQVLVSVALAPTLLHLH
ncbi:hypothetical protein FRC01_009314, partial [Tulasnella sp. 417]